MKSSRKDRRDALLWTHKTLDVRVISFPGAKGSGDWTKLISEPIGICSNLTVHQGVASLLESYSVSSVSAFGSDYDFDGKCATGVTFPANWKNVILTGFSLGGALATLLGAISNDTWDGSVTRPTYKGGNVPHNPVLSFGNPPVIYSSDDFLPHQGRFIHYYVTQIGQIHDVANLAWSNFRHAGRRHGIVIAHTVAKALICYGVSQVLNKVTDLKLKIILRDLICRSPAVETGYLYQMVSNHIGDGPLKLVFDNSIGIALDRDWETP
jgi:hypothetical protein